MEKIILLVLALFVVGLASAIIHDHVDKAIKKNTALLRAEFFKVKNDIWRDIDTIRPLVTDTASKLIEISEHLDSRKPVTLTMPDMISIQVIKPKRVIRGKAN